MDPSPFAHAPKVPGARLTWMPLVILTAVLARGAAAGLAGLRRRDVG